MKDSFYMDFSDCGLMPNKNEVYGKGARPCFFSFQDKTEPQIYWFVPISSKTEKYETIAEKNIAKYGKCDFLAFGNVLGSKAVFLIQNMFPITKNYIQTRYIVNGVPVRTDNPTALEVIAKAKLVIEKQKRGIKLTFTDINKIYNALNKQIEDAKIHNLPVASDAEKTVTKSITSKLAVEIMPQRKFGENKDGAVLVKLEGKTAGEKIPVWLPKGSFELDRDGQNIVKVSASMQAQHNFPRPGIQAASNRKL